MAKYILSKQVKGKKYLYTVKDENGNVVSTRTSARNYVACTADGSFYFGRLDLIGKGDHGKRLSHTAAILANPEKEYKKMVAYFTPDYREQWKTENATGADGIRPYPVGGVGVSRYADKRHDLTIYVPGFPEYQ